MRAAHIDFETRSKADIFLGLDQYARHPSTEVILASWCVDDGPMQQWEIGDPPEKIQELLEIVEDPTLRKWAHNAQFERAILKHVLKCDSPIEEWRCSMAMAYMLGLPGKLADLGKVLKLPDVVAKVDGGKALIRMFCSPRTGKKAAGTFWQPHEKPEEWEQFKHYNRQDVVAEKFVVEKRLGRYELLEREWQEWYVDQKINDHGCPIDRPFVKNARGMVASEIERLATEMKLLTGLDNPNSDTQFGPWVRERGYEFGDLRKNTVTQALEDIMLDDAARRALGIRAQLKKTSVKKYETIDDALVDDCIRYLFQFSGAARTGRWAGRLAQFQNLAKPIKRLEPHYDHIVELVRAGDLEGIDLCYGDVMTALSGVIRACVRARPGRILHVADLAAIEARVVAYLARCPAFLEVFHQGLDPYKAFATQMYRVPYDQVTKQMRTNCKPPVLGGGFRLGGGMERKNPKTGDIEKTGLWGYAHTLGVPLTKEESHAAVASFRETYPEIVQFWYDLENGAKQVITSGGSVDVGYLTIDAADPFLRIRLPSGRRLHYLRPKIELRTTSYGKEKWTVTFEGQEDDGTSKFWGRVATHGGKLTENVVQAMANDVLRWGISNAHEKGHNIVLHAHDEIVTEDLEDADIGLESLRECMTRQIPWAPDLPLDSAGFSTPFYRKD